MTLVGISARAQDPVFEKILPDQSTMYRSLKLKYDVNLDRPELKRAWLKAYYEEPFLLNSDGPLPRPQKLPVPGLSYDPKNHEIVYSGDAAGPVVCATGLQSGFFRGLTYHETGKCLLDLSKGVIDNDDGLKVKRQHVIKVHLFIHD